MWVRQGNLDQPLHVGIEAHKLIGFNKSMNEKREKRRRAEIQKQIDENLRRVYEQDSTEEVPDRLLQLLERLREQEQ